MNSNAAPARPRILVADDNPDYIKDMEILLGRDFTVRTCTTAEQAQTIHRQGWPSLILLDIEFPGRDGLEALEDMVGHDVSIPVIILTSHEDYRLAAAAMRKGAFYFLGKTQDPAILVETIRAALRHNEALKRCTYLEQQLEKIRGTAASLVLGPSEASQNLRAEIERAAAVDVGVLIVGETGSGKELVARLIHQKSPRGSGPFEPVELHSEPETLIASKLFGHEAGAYSGATARRIGAFEAAQGGSVLLDEVGDIPLSLQATLLRVLQDKVVMRLGSHGGSGIVCDVRFMAATFRDLEQMVADGEFREDLYHRLRVLTIEVPPLRERREDIPLLVQHFLQKYREATSSTVTTVAPAAIRILCQRRWKGNVRQLENVIAAAMVRARGTTLAPEHVEAGRQMDLADEAEDARLELAPYHDARQVALSAFKKEYLARAMALTGGVVNQAARLAGLPQASFRKMMREVGVKRLE